MDSLSSTKAQLLLKIFSQKDRDLKKQVSKALKWATQALEMDLGIISHIIDGKYIVREFWPPSDALTIDQEFELRNTYCSLAIEKKDVFHVTHMGDSEYKDHNCYEQFKLESYIGKPFHLDASLYGTINFSSSEPKKQEFSEDDVLFVRLLSGWMSSVIHRIEIEEQLKSEHRLYKMLTTNSAELICMHEMDGTYTYVSPSVKDLLGYSPRELIGSNPYHLFHPDDLERIAKESHEPTIAGEAYPSIQYRIKRKDGSYIWFDTATQPIKDLEENVIALQTTSRDVTEKKRLELLTHETQRMTSIGGWEYNLQTDELFWSDEVYRIHELEDSESITVERALSFYPKESRVKIEAAMEEVQTTGETREFEVPFITAKGKRIWVRVFLGAEFAGFEPIKLFGAFQDITEKKRLEELFIESQRMAKVGGWEFDLETGELFWSDEVYRIHEIPVGTKVFVEDGLSYYPEGEARQNLINALEYTQKTGEPYDLELPFITSKKNHIWVRAMGHAEIVDGKAIKLIGTFQNITAKKKFEQQIQDQLKQLSELKVTREKLYSIIAHDLRNSIFGITGLLDLLIEDVSENDFTPDKLVEKLNLVFLSADYSYKMLDNMLTWVRLQSGLLTIKAHHFDLKNSIEATVDLLNPAIKRKQLGVDININADTELVGEPNLVTTVIRNLVNNAIKFSNSGGSIIITVEDKDADYIAISITDSGVGMDSKTQENLFNQDFRPQRKGTLNEKGTGLGLILVQELVDLHHGSLEVESKLNIGSTFTVKLPKQYTNSEN